MKPSIPESDVLAAIKAYEVTHEEDVPEGFLSMRELWAAAAQARIPRSAVLRALDAAHKEGRLSQQDFRRMNRAGRISLIPHYKIEEPA